MAHVGEKLAFCLAGFFGQLFGMLKNFFAFLQGFRHTPLLIDLFFELTVDIAEFAGLFRHIFNLLLHRGVEVGVFQGKTNLIDEDGKDVPVILTEGFCFLLVGQVEERDHILPDKDRHSQRGGAHRFALVGDDGFRIDFDTDRQLTDGLETVLLDRRVFEDGICIVEIFRFPPF